jgi:hypothetical protein
MPQASKLSSTCAWKTAVCAAGLAVGGALAMTVVLGTVAMLSAAIRGLPAAQVPRLLTTDASFPWFCAVAGVFSALGAGYITSRTGGAMAKHWLASGALTVAGHGCVVALLGSPLGPVATAAYIGLMMPAVCLGFYVGAPSRRASP